MALVTVVAEPSWYRATRNRIAAIVSNHSPKHAVLQRHVALSRSASHRRHRVATVCHIAAIALPPSATSLVEARCVEVSRRAIAC